MQKMIFMTDYFHVAQVHTKKILIEQFSLFHSQDSNYTKVTPTGFLPELCAVCGIHSIIIYFFIIILYCII